MKTSEKGRLGELAAAEHLKAAGCEILCRNYRTRLGEIDIIAADAQYLLFVEVKARAQGSLLLPREAVSLSKQRKIILAAEQYLSERPVNLQPRFDVIEVVLAPGEGFRVLSIRQIKNAFTLD